jgi:hypothetical protein
MHLIFEGILLQFWVCPMEVFMKRNAFGWWFVCKIEAGMN